MCFESSSFGFFFSFAAFILLSLSELSFFPMLESFIANIYLLGDRATLDNTFKLPYSTPSTDIATHLPPHIPWPIASPLGSYLSAQRRKYTVIRTMSPAVRTNVIGSNTHYPRIHRLITTKFPKRVAASHTTKAIDYCPLLNCNFEGSIVAQHGVFSLAS